MPGSSADDNGEHALAGAGAGIFCASTSTFRRIWRSVWTCWLP